MKVLLARLSKAVAWNAASTIALQGGTFLSALAVANLIGPDRFGQFGLVLGTAQTFAAVLQLSTGIAATKYVSEFREKDKRLAALALRFCGRVSLVAGTAGTVALLVAASTIATVVLRAPSLVIDILIVSPVVLFAVLSGFQLGALAGLEGFKSAARVLLMLAPIQIATTSLAAYYFGVSGAIAATALNLGLRTLVCSRLIQIEAERQWITPSTSSRQFSREIFFTFLLPGALSGLTAMPALWIGTVELSKSSSGGFEQVAYFNAAFAIRGMLMIFPWVLSSVGLALLSNSLGNERRAHFRALLFSNLAITFASVILGVSLVTFLGHWILRLYGANFVVGFPVLQILMVSFAAEALTLPILQALISHARMWSIFMLVLLPRDAILVGCALYWVREHGAMGLGVAHSTAYGFAMLITILLYHLLRRPPEREAGQDSKF